MAKQFPGNGAKNLLVQSTSAQISPGFNIESTRTVSENYGLSSKLVSLKANKFQFLDLFVCNKSLQN